MPQTAREIFLPGPGAPHWLSGGPPPGGLLYLAWGRRHFGQHPIPQRLHHGWTYQVVISGQPVFLVGSRERKVSPGDVIIAGPDVPYGWTDQPRGACSLLVWIWTRPPELGAKLRPRTCWIRSCTTEIMSEFQELHGRTRREIQHPDALSAHALPALQNLLDITCARCETAPDNNTAREKQRLRLAEEWMLRHLDIRAPAGALADYLGLSPMTLQRLFRSSTGRSPGQAFLELKMREASSMLQRQGASVKEVALGLGYRHPGDFTRAYRRHHGVPPSEAGEAKRVKQRSPDKR